MWKTTLVAISRTQYSLPFEQRARRGAWNFLSRSRFVWTYVYVCKTVAHWIICHPVLRRVCPVKCIFLFIHRWPEIIIILELVQGLRKSCGSVTRSNARSCSRALRVNTYNQMSLRWTACVEWKLSQNKKPMLHLRNWFVHFVHAAIELNVAVENLTVFFRTLCMHPHGRIMHLYLCSIRLTIHYTVQASRIPRDRQTQRFYISPPKCLSKWAGL